jgi:FkbM family methyltransferase
VSRTLRRTKLFQRKTQLSRSKPAEAPRTVEFGHHAQNDRWVVDAVFPGLRGGFYVEAGACGGLRGSASYVLEREFAWQGICVEPGDKYFEILRQKRACAKDNRCLADRSGDIVEFLSYPDDPARSGIKSLNKNDDWAARNNAEGVTSTKETVTLADLLDEHRAPAIVHYLCLDVEGAERHILEPFDFDGPHRILALSVEGSKCDNLLGSRGYVQVRNPFAPDRIDHYFLHESLREQCRELRIDG